MADTRALDRTGSRTTSTSWITAGAVAGLVAGIIFAMFEMIVAWMMGNPFFGPLRMIGAIALGEEALQPTYSLLTAAAVGMMVHMAMSIIFGAIAGAIISAVTTLQTSPAALIVATSVFGFLLWIVNFFIIAPAAFEWFTMTDNTVQFIAHTFFYGTALGLLLIGWLRSRESMTD